MLCVHVYKQKLVLLLFSVRFMRIFPQSQNIRSKNAFRVPFVHCEDKLLMLLIRMYIQVFLT